MKTSETGKSLRKKIKFLSSLTSVLIDSNERWLAIKRDRDRECLSLSLCVRTILIILLRANGTLREKNGFFHWYYYGKWNFSFDATRRTDRSFRWSKRCSHSSFANWIHFDLPIGTCNNFDEISQFDQGVLRIVIDIVMSSLCPFLSCSPSSSLSDWNNLR